MSIVPINSNVRLKVVIISLIAFLSGVVLLLVYAFNVNNTGIANWFMLILQELASILIISGTLSVISEYFTKADFIKEIRETEERIITSMYTTDSIQRLGDYGISDCFQDWSQFSFNEFLREAKELTICLNDSRSWVSVNISALIEHMRDPKSSTKLIVINPESTYARMLAGKTNVEHAYLSEKIKDANRKLIETYERIANSKGKLEIYWHDLPVMNGVYLSDKRAILTPYTISRPRARVPLFILTKSRKASYYELIQIDMKNLLEDTSIQKVFSATNGVVDCISEEIRPIQPGHI